ncbi:MAG: Lrp/AsnC family transcriptional regulator [Thermoplasmatales archaeon]
MKSEKITLDQLNSLDRKILLSMFDTRETNLSVISKKVGVSKSTVHNRLKKMKSSNFLKGIIPLISQTSLDKSITAVSLINAKYGPEYGEAIGSKIAKIKGVWAVYFVLGSIDFVALIRAKNKTELGSIVNELSRTPGVERSETIMALNTAKEDFPESLKLIIKE